MKPKIQRPIVFNNTSNCIVDYLELEKAILWYQKEPSKSKKKIYLFGFYPAVTIKKEKIHVHRLLMMYWEGRLLKRKEYCHHKNHNKLDCTKSNIEIINASLHQSMHNKGKKISEEHKECIRKSNKKRIGTTYKKRNIHENKDLI
tara:strand:- start:8 stop:442 length:435 start_codon:yes stop_codon:yes gene_type:complete